MLIVINQVHAIRDFTKKLPLIESFLASHTVINEHNVTQKASTDTEAHSKFCQTSKMKLVKLVVKFRVLHFRNLEKF